MKLEQLLVDNIGKRLTEIGLKYYKKLPIGQVRNVLDDEQDKTDERFLDSLEIDYILKMDAGEVDEYFFFNRDMQLLVVVDNGEEAMLAQTVQLITEHGVKTTVYHDDMKWKIIILIGWLLIGGMYLFVLDMGQRKIK